MKSHIKTTRFWLAWIFASLLVYPLVFAFLFAFGMVISTVAQVFLQEGSLFSSSSDLSELFYLTVISSGLGGIVGLAIGMLQKYVIKRYFRIEFEHWQRATVIGGMVAAPVMALAMNGITTYMGANYWQLIESGQYYVLDTISAIMPMVLYVTVLSAIQIVILRQYVMNAWLWIISNTVAGLMFSMLVANAFDPGFGNWLLAAIAQGAVTGFAMLWLLHRLNKEIEVEDEREFAYQYVPIETDDPTDPSIWDDSI